MESLPRPPSKTLPTQRDNQVAAHPEATFPRIVMTQHSLGTWLTRTLRTMTRSGERAPAPERYETNLEWFAFLGGNTVSTHGSESDDVGGGHAGAGSAEIETGGRRGLLLLRPWQWGVSAGQGRA